MLAAVPFRRALEIAFLLMTAAASVLGWRAGGGGRGSAAFCVTAMGFTLLALEVLLLLGFQAIYGYVYQQLAIIIGAFMAGMALGSWGALRWLQRFSEVQPEAPMRRLVITQILATVSPLLFYFLLAGLASTRSIALSSATSTAVFPLLALLAGALGGYQFPVANRIYFEEQATPHPGTLYALDLAGACAGALLISAYLVPVFGFLRTGELIALINLVPAAMAMISLRAAGSKA
jgi:spermidine synthase